MRLSRAALFVLTLTASSLVGVVAAGPARADTTICDKFGSTTIQSGRYIVQNNVWGASTTQCLNVTSTGFSITRADHNLPPGGAPASYPSIYAGCHYGNCSAGSSLPMRATDSRFASVRTSASLSYPNSGTWDAAYDIWFDPTARTNGQNTGEEIMVWTNDRGGIAPVGHQVATVNLAGGTWNVWEGNIGWNVVSYVRTAATGSVSFAVNTFFNDTVNRGFAQRSWYLTSVQAGLEPHQSGAGFAVNSFSYSVG